MRHVEDAVVFATDLETNLPHITSNLLAKFPEEHLLIFWTSSATFDVVYPEEEDTSIGGPEGIRKRVPLSLFKPRAKIRNQQKNNVGSACGIAAVDRESGGHKTGLYEFIVLGRREVLDFKPELVVLRIERRDGIAYRMNQGVIYEETWVEAKHKWELVALG